MEKKLRRTFKGKTINLYNEEKSVGPEIQTREGEDDFGTVRIRKIKYRPNLDMPTINPGHIWDDVIMSVSPANSSTPSWLRWTDNLDRALRNEKNLTLRISCTFAGGSMWLVEGAKFGYEGWERAAEVNNVTNTKFMKDIQDTFCKSPEMKQMDKIMNGLKKTKTVEDADYAQVDDQEDSEELV